MCPPNIRKPIKRIKTDPIFDFDFGTPKFRMAVERGLGESSIYTIERFWIKNKSAPLRREIKRTISVLIKTDSGRLALSELARSHSGIITLIELSKSDFGRKALGELARSKQGRIVLRTRNLTRIKAYMQNVKKREALAQKRPEMYTKGAIIHF